MFLTFIKATTLHHIRIKLLDLQQSRCLIRKILGKMFFQMSLWYSLQFMYIATPLQIHMMWRINYLGRYIDQNQTQK